jgi:hypothetical protein
MRGIDVKSLLAAFLIAITVIGFSLVGLTHFSLAQDVFTISGYILDSSGHGVADAYIIFNNVSTPRVSTDNSGYYVMPAPAGTYHINVWPPFDSHYINYDEPGFVVGSDITKNITLTSGCKVSGYITDSSGAPVVGAAVLFRDSVNIFGSGWFSTSVGYYFLSVPAGTYTIDAHPRTAYGYNYSGFTTDFPTYYEYNFVVSGNTVKNITVGASSSPSSLNSESASSPESSFEQSPASFPEPTSTSPATVTPDQITISTKASTMTLLGIIIGIVIVATPIVAGISVCLLLYFKKRDH